jgi:hypothetical protein
MKIQAPNGRIFIRFALLALIFGMIILLSDVHASAKDYSKLTLDAIEKMPKAEQKALPMFILFDRMNKNSISKGGDGSEFSKTGAHQILEFMLRRLRYYDSKITGKPNIHLTKAIKDFQKTIKVEPTGNLLMGEWETMGKALKLLEPPKVFLDSKSIFLEESFGLLSARGTWTFKNDKMANPLQSSKILCRKKAGVCQVVTAEIATFNDEQGNLNIDVADWEITRWAGDEVVAENNGARCVSLTMTINFIKKEAFQFRRGKSGDFCKGFAIKPQILVLVDGFDVSWDYYQRRREEAHKFMNPNTNILNGSNSTKKGKK